MRQPIVRAALAALVLAAACKGSETVQPAGPPANIVTAAAPTSSVTAGAAAGEFRVRVTDANGIAVVGARVVFSVTGGGTASPSAAATDDNGEARSTITVGSTAGTVTVTATVSGTALHATVNITALAGPIARLVLTPEAVRLNAVGDTLRLTVSGTDASGNAVAAPAVSFLSTDPGAVTVSAAGTVRAVRVDATALVIASAGTMTDTTVVVVSGPNSSLCSGVAIPRTLAVGEVFVYQGASAGCLVGSGTNGAEFTLVAFNGDTAFSQSTTISSAGLGAAPATSLASATAPSLRTVGSTLASTTLQPDLAFHLALQSRSRALAPRFPAARQWQRARTSIGGTSTRSAQSSVASFSAIGASPAVGDILKMNVNGNFACTSPDVRAVRVVAIGTKSIILADTLNPAGGFTTADYQKFATRFDNDIYPLDVANFGEPSDIDKNGKVGILFTRAVNELTPPNNPSYVGGFFYGRDLFPKAATPEFGAGCEGSNEGEMFYMLAPDPNGVVNGNVRPTSLILGLTASTIAHEFQHLINASRRIYVNTDAQDYEVVWLNEGLSHVAEELLYYKDVGKTPRLNLTDANIRQESSTQYGLWKEDVSQDFGRFSDYLSAPEASSPTVEDDELSTRGATWSFLRYSADRFYTTDGDTWFRLVNSTTTGFATLRLAFGTDQVSLLRDWSMANYLDDLGVNGSAAYQHKSWNFHDIYTRTFIAARYPLKVTAMSSGASFPVTVRQTSAAYFRFSVPATQEGLIRFANTGSTPSDKLQFIVVRTK